MAQTSYGYTQDEAFAGILRDNGEAEKRSFVNSEASAQLPFGIGVVQGSAFDDCKLPSAATDQFVGVTIHGHGRGVDWLTGTAGIGVDEMVSVLEEGVIVVVTEQSMSPGDKVYCRHSVNTTEQLGAFRKDSDSGKARYLKGARVIKNISSTLAAIYFDVALDSAAQGDQVEFYFSHAGSLAATTTVKVALTKSDRHFVIDEVVYNNPTGFAADPTNYWSLALKQGSTAAASRDTLTGSGGAITADSFGSFTNAALASRVAPPATELSLVLTKVASGANFPAGIGFVRGHYI